MQRTAPNPGVRRRTVLATTLALLVLGAFAAPASAQVGPPVQECGQGQKPSVDMCFPPAECQVRTRPWTSAGRDRSCARHAPDAGLPKYYA